MERHFSNRETLEMITESSSSSSHTSGESDPDFVPPSSSPPTSSSDPEKDEEDTGQGNVETAASSALKPWQRRQI